MPSNMGILSGLKLRVLLDKPYGQDHLIFVICSVETFSKFRTWKCISKKIFDFES